MDEMRITIVPVEDIDEISLPNGSWSKMLLTGDTVSGIVSSLGFSVFTPGTELSMVSHDTEEVAYVVSGAGEIRTESGESRSAKVRLSTYRLACGTQW